MQKEDQKKPTLKVGESLPEGQNTDSGSLTGKGLENTRAAAEAADSRSVADVVIDDRYQVLEFIGEGGMGSVYKVQDRVLEKVFAIKLVKPELLKDNIAMKRFEQEAQGAISLTHPNLVSVYGHKLTASGQPFLLMDYHPGSNLADVISQHGKIAPEEAVDLFAHLSDALMHAHAKGIIHRDLKPSNIIIQQNEMGKLDPKIVDFGISKILSSNVTTMGFTKEQQVFGTPHYMSPEMCRGEKLDARSDVYSLGCLMFEVVEGRPPYQMENPFQTLMQHVSGDLPKFAQPSTVPAPLQGIILKCLAKDPSHRYQSMEHLRRDLERFKQGQKLEFAKPHKAFKIEPKQLAIAGGALACFGTGVLLMSIFQGGNRGAMLPVFTSQSFAPAVITNTSTNSGSDLLTWKLPVADPNNPESLILRLRSAEEQCDLRSRSFDYRNGERIPYEQQRLRGDATQILEKQTQAALVALGERAVPTILNHMSDDSRRVRNVCFGVVKELGSIATKPFVGHLMSSGKSVNDAMIANAVSELGKPAISELITYVPKGGDTQTRALQFILVASTHGGNSLIDTSDVKSIANVIESQAPVQTRKIAMLILVTVADRDDSIRELFTKIAQDQTVDSDLQVTAISALGTIANMESIDASPSTQTVLQKIATSDKDAYIRFSATSNIGALGVKGKPSAATLTKLTKDRDAAVAMAAKTGLALINGATVGERGSMSNRDMSEFIGEINSTITQPQLNVKISRFGSALGSSPFYALPTHPDFCGFVVPVLMNHIDRASDRFGDKRYSYETLSKMGHYGGPSVAWVVLKASRETDRWSRSTATQAISNLMGVSLRY